MADKKINISLGISADLNDFQKKIEKLQSEFDKVKFSDLSSEKISKVFDNIQSRLKKLQELTDKSPSLLGKTDYKQAEKEVGNLQTDISKLVKEIQQLDTASKEGKLEHLTIPFLSPCTHLQFLLGIGLKVFDKLKNSLL
jgi:septation ring formation regulator EzrA